MANDSPNTISDQEWQRLQQQAAQAAADRGGRWTDSDAIARRKAENARAKNWRSN